MERVPLNVVVMEADWECRGLPVGVMVCDGDAVGLAGGDNETVGVGEVVKVGVNDGEGFRVQVMVPVGVGPGDGDRVDEGVNAKLEVWDPVSDGVSPDPEGVRVGLQLDVGLIE